MPWSGLTSRRQLMVFHQRLVGLACVFSAFHVGLADYLPRLGPSDLRFRAAPEPASLKILLPPLPSLAAVSNLNAAAQLSAGTNAPAAMAKGQQLPSNPAEVAPSLPPLESSMTNQSLASLIDTNFLAQQILAASRMRSDGKASEVVTPQMLLEYFQKRTDPHNENGVAVPVTFTPPVPAPPPSSKATYTTE